MVKNLLRFMLESVIVDEKDINQALIPLERAFFLVKYFSFCFENEKISRKKWRKS